MTHFRMFTPLAAAAAAAAAALALSACATTPYTGPVEVTRFVAPAPVGLGEGPILVYVPEDAPGDRGANTALIKAAVEAELIALGYTIAAQEGRGVQVATVRSARKPIAQAPVNGRGPVSVGVGGQTGSYGSGVGLGVGINLGGGREGPDTTTELSVRISDDATTTLWEGRAELTTGAKSPYAKGEASARTLAAALFRDFPGGNGETVTINVKKLQGAR